MTRKAGVGVGAKVTELFPTTVCWDAVSVLFCLSPATESSTFLMEPDCPEKLTVFIGPK